MMTYRPQVKFRRTAPRLWLGNGFGYRPAEYAVVQDGVDIAELVCSKQGDWWRAYMEGEKWLDAPTLADLKIAVRDALNTA